jgi:hypothetical protein
LCTTRSLLISLDPYKRIVGMHRDSSGLPVGSLAQKQEQADMESLMSK